MGQYGHPLAKVRLKQTGSSAPVIPPIEPPAATVEYNPNFVFLMASTVVASLTQRNQIVTDILDIWTTTGGAVRPDICANVSWDDSEDTEASPGMGNYVFTRFTDMRTMCQQINEGIGLTANSPNGAKYWAKLYLRNYSSGQGGVSLPSVPRYMRADVGGNQYAGTVYIGAGVNANGEYQGTLNEGSGAGNLTRQAKIWVPAVAERWKQWLIAIGNFINEDPLCAGIIINETSVLSAKNTATDPYGTDVNTPGSPTADANIIELYFQNYFQAAIDARPYLNKKEFMISAGHPITTLYGYQPLNPGVLYSLHKFSQFTQDAYKADTPTPKGSVREIAKQTQPYAIDTCSYASLISGDIRRHKGVDRTQEASSTTTHNATTGTKIFTVTELNKTFTPTRQICFIANTNESTQVVLTGTITAWDGTADQRKLTVSITGATGSGSRSAWEIAEGANYYPPHTLDEMIEYAVTAKTSHPWDPPTAPHNFKGSTHVFFQINTTVKTGANENSRNYIEYVNYCKTTSRRVKTARPNKL